MSRTVWYLGVAGSGLVAAVVACASGKKDDGGFAGSGGTVTSSSTSVGGMGGTTNSSNGGDGGSGGTLPVCDEQPCRLLLTQCGCPAGKMCVISNYLRTCVTTGTKALGEQCTGNTCQPGLECVQNGGPPATCHAFCVDDGQCQGPGGVCVLQLSDGNGGTLPDKLCSTNCDPLSGGGCSVSGNKCDIGYDATNLRYFTLCGADGVLGQGQTCNDTTDCAVGLSCFTTNPSPVTKQCLHYCTYSNGAGCPLGTTCVELNPIILIGGTEYGACL